MTIIDIEETTTGAPLPVNLFRTMARRWHRHTAHLFHPYRPERHYMRGPGPKWREKNGLSGSTLE
jgi:hypothetical protein